MAEGIIQKAGGGGTSDECTAGKAQVLAGYTAITRDSGDEPVNGTMVNHTGVPSKIENRRLNNGRFEVAVAQGYHGCYWAGDSYEYMELAEVASTLGLTAAKLLKGQMVCGIAGTATSDANATAAYIYSGKTAYVNGAKVTGSMTVSSVVSFSVAAYSTSQVLCTWKNPAKGPYSGVVICAKAGGYPTSINDNRKYTGVGSNSALNGTSTAIISGLTAGTTYYFRIWVYCTCSAGDLYSGYLQATCAPTTHGRKVFTSSGTFTVPAGVRSIRSFAVGGGGAGQPGYDNKTGNPGGNGGAGGFTKTLNWTEVTPGTQYPVTVGAGNQVSASDGTGGISSLGNLLSASGGRNGNASAARGVANGGSGGGRGGRTDTKRYGGKGGSDGGYGWATGGSLNGDSTYSSMVNLSGQGSTTREFGSASGTLYAAGGGGGAAPNTGGPANGGEGGGGNGGFIGTLATAGGSGTGSGGGGARGGYSANTWLGASGGSGVVIVEW